MANNAISNSIPNSIPEHMRVTPERALAIKRALIRQYADQFNLEITGWDEISKDGVRTSYSLKEQSPA